MFQPSIHVFVLLVSAIFIWLGTLSFFLYKALAHYNRLGRGVTHKNLSTLLETILSEVELSRKEVQEISRRCDKIEQDGAFHVQKIGLLRFNPFTDTGGNQSFILAILNGKEDGVLISSLHGRTGTRWYAKTVKAGKGLEHQLSNEEREAMKKAKPIG